MAEEIKHECGIAFIRLRKPLEYYLEKYNTPAYAINKLYLLMEKQHNRGQDGAGVAAVHLDIPAGFPYIHRIRQTENQAIKYIFEKIHKPFEKLPSSKWKNARWLKENVPFSGEILLGHLRYGTYGSNTIQNCHPFIRQNNWMTRNLVLAGNFNLTNNDEIFTELIEIGQHPKEKTDTVTVMEKIGHFLDEENDQLVSQFKALGYSKKEITSLIIEHLKPENILRNASKKWDGGYLMTGILGHGDAFIFRDPNGIRPGFYYIDDEIIVVASERPAIQTAFNLKTNQIHEIPPGQALIIKKSGEYYFSKILEPGKKLSCSFERIYFSRGSDEDIYRERKKLGQNLCEKVLQSINYDLDNTVFSFIPNTAEVAFLGLIKALEDYINLDKIKILSQGNNFSETELKTILQRRARVEKIAIKDAKLRTFITQDSSRNDLVAHVYDITYGTIREGIDTLVVLDDSIVRGTTLRESILRMLDRLGPKKIVVVSSAPQIRYPDCYGIDMAKLGDLVAFQAAIALIKERNMEHLIDEVYALCKQDIDKPKEEIVNHVKKIYDPFTADEISDKISELLHPADIKADVQIVYQTIEGLHDACPNHLGDWYFTGNYPTPGGNKVAIKSFIYYMENIPERAY